MRTSKFVAALGAASILACGFFGPTADAKVISGNDRDIPAASVDTTQPISLVVKKAATNPYDDVPAGQKPPAIAGATFKLSLVDGIDVTTDAGRAAAKQLSLGDAKAKGLTRISTSRTDKSGAASFDDLKPGLYLLEEEAPNDGHEYHVSSPQLIILPLGDVRGTEFKYENVVVTKWDGSDGGEPPTSTPTPSPSTSTTERTTEKTTEKTTETSTERTTEFTPVESTITSTMPNGSTTVITTRPSTYVTTQPDGSVTTVTQPSDGGRRGGDLASTGANVLWAAGLGGLLILVGFLLARRSKNEETTR
ncbi:LPXTG cell wall anchor domain-containing protein [Corynebacterium afermentans]|nr:LPXTG cell wall anchor domain-containing protein [Corynebacterium afermentans]